MWLFASKAGLVVGLATATPVVGVLAAASDGPVYTDPAFWITPAGLVAALAGGLLVPRPTYQRERAAADRLAQLFETRMLDLAEKYATTMHESSAALEKSADVLSQATGVQQEVLRLLQEDRRPPPRRRAGT